MHAVFAGLLALPACTTAAALPADFEEFVRQAPADAPARLWLAGDRIVAAAVAVGPGALPRAVRTTLDAVAPGGELVWQGREWGPRGEGFRIDKRYREGTAEHVRSALIAQDGSVLERCHSLPLAEVPPNVLGKALETGSHVEEARIVSGPEREEYWSCTVTSRIGRTFVVEIDLDGKPRRSVRRVDARVEL